MCEFYQNPRSPVQFDAAPERGWPPLSKPLPDPPQAPKRPASVREIFPVSEYRLHLADTGEDGSRESALITDEDRYEALAVIERLMDLHGSLVVSTLAWNLAAERVRQGRA